MLSKLELAQVRREVIADMAAIDAATYGHHGSYTHLCAIDDELVYTHQPVGRVMHQFVRPPVEEET